MAGPAPGQLAVCSHRSWAASADCSVLLWEHPHHHHCWWDHSDCQTVDLERWSDSFPVPAGDGSAPQHQCWCKVGCYWMNRCHGDLGSGQHRVDPGW